jgi:hypothetical protein
MTEELTAITLIAAIEDACESAREWVEKSGDYQTFSDESINMILVGIAEVEKVAYSQLIGLTGEEIPSPLSTEIKVALLSKVK